MMVMNSEKLNFTWSYIYAKQILIVSIFMELNGFMIGPEIKTLFKIKVGAVIVEHPVAGWEQPDLSV